MNFKQTVLRTSIISALGLAGVSVLMPSTAAAVVIADGNYLAVINTTPVVDGVPQFGTDGAWNSSWGYENAPNINSQKMTNNSTTISTPNGTRGSSMLGNGAGSFNLSLSGGSFTASGFQVDAIFGTAGGTFVQYGSITGGTVTGSGGMTLDVTGRLGAFSGAFPSPGSLHDERWNVNDFNSGAGGGTAGLPDVPCSSPPVSSCTNGNTAYTSFTTGAVQNYATQGNSTNPGAHTAGLGFLNADSITGAEAVALGDINSDGLTDYRLILVSAGHFGTDWNGFFGVPYFETWNINLLSQPASAVPLPAAAWLFGSGVLGLAAVARRKRQRGK
jgi:hypothetical protein